MEASSEAVHQAVGEASTLRGIHALLTGGRGSTRTLAKRLALEGYDVADLALNGIRHGAAGRTTPLEEILVEGSSFPTKHLKNRLLAKGLLENRCSLCGLPPEWHGQALVMRLDHINGVADDHRFENLRLVCPNCDSQLPTFAGRNIKRS
jgi:hypothetical protein